MLPTALCHGAAQLYSVGRRFNDRPRVGCLLSLDHDPTEYAPAMPEELDEILTCLQLARAEGVGPVTFAGLLQRHCTAAAALRVLRQLPTSDGSLRRIPDRQSLQQELAALAEIEAGVLVKPASDYPRQLQPLPDARRCSRCAATPRCSTARRWRSSAPATPAPTAARSPAGWPRAGRGRAGRRLRPRPRHRHRGARGCARRRRCHGGGDRRRRRRRLSARERRTDGSGSRAEGAVVSERPLGAGAAGQGLSPPQPGHRRPGARRRRGRGGTRLGLADHRPAGRWTTAAR